MKYILFFLLLCFSNNFIKAESILEVLKKGAEDKSTGLHIFELTLIGLGVKVLLPQLIKQMTKRFEKPFLYNDKKNLWDQLLTLFDLDDNKTLILDYHLKKIITERRLNKEIEKFTSLVEENMEEDSPYSEMKNREKLIEVLIKIFGKVFVFESIQMEDLLGFFWEEKLTDDQKLYWINCLEKSFGLLQFIFISTEGVSATGNLSLEIFKKNTQESFLKKFDSGEIILDRRRPVTETFVNDIPPILIHVARCSPTFWLLYFYTAKGKILMQQLLSFYLSWICINLLSLLIKSILCSLLIKKFYFIDICIDDLEAKKQFYMDENKKLELKQQSCMDKNKNLEYKNKLLIIHEKYKMYEKNLFFLKFFYKPLCYIIDYIVVFYIVVRFLNFNFITRDFKSFINFNNFSSFLPFSDQYLRYCYHMADNEEINNITRWMLHLPLFILH